jgi:hypothetical protein
MSTVLEIQQVSFLELKMAAIFGGQNKPLLNDVNNTLINIPLF